jgi:large subunit ribosomal protein L22
MTGTKTNERPGVRAQHRHARMSATKARVVLDLIRGKSVAEARTILQFSERGASDTIAKVLDSAVANAANNNDIPPEELFVATAYADEGPTLKRWRPRARGRATRIRKRTCHITIIVARYSAEDWERIRTRQAESGRATPDAASARARRVAGSRRRSGAAAEEAPVEDAPTPEEELAGDEAATEAVVTETFAEDAEDAGVADADDTADEGDAADDGGAAAEEAGDEAATEAVIAEDSAELADEAAAGNGEADEAAETEKKDED